MHALPIEPSDALDEGGLLELFRGSVDLSPIIGVAIACTEAISAEKLVSCANSAMYRSDEQRQGLPVLASSRSMPDQCARLRA